MMSQNKDSLTEHKYLDTWEVVECNKRRSLNREEIYARFSFNHNKMYLHIYLGLEVTELLGFHQHDKVTILNQKSNDNLIQIKKMPGKFATYTLNRARLANCLSVGFKWERKSCTKLNVTSKVTYEMFDDQSVIIDLSNLICKETK